MGTMYAQFPSKCCLCGKAIAKGAQFHYERGAPRGQKAMHVECLAAKPKAEPQAAPQRAKATQVKGITLHRRNFSSLCDLYESTKKIPAINSDVFSDISTRRNGDSTDKLRQWYGVPVSWKGVLRIVNEGWPEGLQRVEDALRTVDAPPLAGIKRRIVRSDFGDELDIHRINRGEFETAWSRRSRRHAAFGHAQKTLLMFLGGLCDVKADQLFWRGAAAMKICDSLVEAGYSVEIIGVFASNTISVSGNDSEITTFTVKRHDMPLDRLELATVATLAGFFRTVGFMSKMSLPIPIRENLGFTDATLVPSEYLNNPDVIAGLERVGTQEQAQQFINNCILSLGNEDAAQAA